MNNQDSNSSVLMKDQIVAKHRRISPPNRQKYKFAINSMIHILKLAVIVIFIQHEFLYQHQVYCRARGVIYNKDGKFIYKPAKASQGHIIVIEDRHPESSGRSQGASSMTSAAYQPIQLLNPRSIYQPGSGLEGAASTLPVRAAAIYAGGQLQLINLNDLRGLTAGSSLHSSLNPSASSSSQHYTLDSRLASQHPQPVQIIPLIQLYQQPGLPAASQARYQVASAFGDRPYGIASNPTVQSPLSANLDFENLQADLQHNPILDNGASITGPYTTAQQFQQQPQQANQAPLQGSQSLHQLPSHLHNFRHPIRARPSESDSLNEVYDMPPNAFDHNGAALQDSPFNDDPRTPFKSLFHEDGPNRHASDSQIRAKIRGPHTSNLHADFDHLDDISDYGEAHNHPQMNPHQGEHQKHFKSSNDGPSNTIGRPSPVINLNQLNQNGSSKSDILDITPKQLVESRLKKTLESNKTKLLKNPKKNVHNKGKISDIRRQVESHTQQLDDLNSRDTKSNQYWSQFKDQFDIMP